MIPVQHFLRFFHIGLFVRPVVEGDFQYRVQVTAQNRGFRRGIGSFGQLSDLFDQLLLHLLGKMCFFDLFQIFGRFLIVLVHAQFFLDDAQLFLEIVFPLVFLQCRPHFSVNVQILLQKRNLLLHGVVQDDQPPVCVALLQNLLFVFKAHNQSHSHTVGIVTGRACLQNCSLQFGRGSGKDVQHGFHELQRVFVCGRGL